MAEDPAEGAEEPEGQAEAGGGVSRRFLLGGGGVGLGGAVAAGWWLSGDRDGASEAGLHQHGETPGGLPEGASPHAQRDALQFFNPHQAMTVEAAAARIIPGDDQNPGAKEAGVIYYIDHMLASNTGYASPAYMEGPFAYTYGDDEEPPEDDDGQTVWIHEDELERYGRQSPFMPREIYRMAAARLDALAEDEHGEQFIDLSENQQDELLMAVEDEEDDVVEVFGDLSPGYFFDVLRSHVLQGFFADPVYGGNRDMVGWQLVGFPGSRRSYSPQDMFNENFDVTPQSLLDLPPFNADHHRHGGEGEAAVRQRHPRGPVD